MSGRQLSQWSLRHISDDLDPGFPLDDRGRLLVAAFRALIQDDSTDAAVFSSRIRPFRLFRLLRLHRTLPQRRKALDDGGFRQSNPPFGNNQHGGNVEQTSDLIGGGLFTDSAKAVIVAHGAFHERQIVAFTAMLIDSPDRIRI